MTGPLAPALRSKILRLLDVHWTPQAIAKEVHCHRNTVIVSVSLKAPVCPAAEDSLIAYSKQ